MEALPFLTGQLFSNTKDTTVTPHVAFHFSKTYGVTKGKPMKSRLFSPFVYSPAPTDRGGVEPFVVKLFPVNYGRNKMGVSREFSTPILT